MYEILFPYTIFFLGLIVGSFLNVVVMRLNTGRSAVFSRSTCFSCSRALSWYELVPLGSFLLQGGRCRACGARISAQYPVVELLTGTVFLFLFLKIFTGAFSIGFLAEFLFYAVIFSALLVILIYDVLHRIIPDRVVRLFNGLSFFFLFLDFESLGFSLPHISMLLSGPLVALPLLFLWGVSGGRWMGFGDVKLALGMGWLLGFAQGFTALVYAFWIGALVSLALVGIRMFLHSLSGDVGSVRLYRALPLLTMKSEVPFAPFLIAGFAVVFFFDLSLFSLFSDLF